MNQRIFIAFFLIVVLLSVFLGPLAANPAAAGSAPVYLVRLTGAVSPANADFLESAIHQANADGAGCLIVMLDTPGGLAESMRRMVMAIFASDIPLVVYVSPSGARAASAGVMITMAADVAAMAPGTHIGAAHPVNAGGKDLDKTMSEKVINDMVAFIKSIAEKRGRNIHWAEKAVRESVSITETEALENKTIDLVARDVDALIDRIDGLEVAGKGRIDIDKAQRVWIDESLRIRVLKALSDPNIAYILMMIGLAGLYFELSHPGVVLPGVVGSIALILAFYSFQTLPVNIAGILLIVLALIFFILEMKIASYGLLSVAGIVSLLLGSMMLFDRGIDGQPGISWRRADAHPYPGRRLFRGRGWTGFSFPAVVRPMTGDSGLIGKTGVVKTALDPIGSHSGAWRTLVGPAAGRRWQSGKRYGLWPSTG